MSVVAHPVPGLYDDEIESQRQPGQGRSVRKRPSIQQPVRGGAHPGAFAMIDGFLREAERTTGSPANLHEHERLRRARVDRHDVQFIAADMDVTGQDDPTGSLKSRGDQCLCRIAHLLSSRSRRVIGSIRHLDIVARGPYPARIPHVSGTYPGRIRHVSGTYPPDIRWWSTRRAELQRFEIQRFEHGVVCHDRDQPVLETTREFVGRLVEIAEQAHLVAGQRALEGQE